MYGKVTDASTGKPLANASVDVWQASTNGRFYSRLLARAEEKSPSYPNRRSALGLYEQQDPNQQDSNLRGKFITDEEGRYSLYCLRPTPYPVS